MDIATTLADRIARSVTDAAPAPQVRAGTLLSISPLTVDMGGDQPIEVRSTDLFDLAITALGAQLIGRTLIVLFIDGQPVAHSTITPEV